MLNLEELYRPMPNRNKDDWNRDWDLFAPFWEGTRRGELLVQECSVTKKKIWPPRFVSPYTPDAELRWVPVEGKGEIYTYNVVYRGFFPYYKDKVPYALVVVDLGNGIRMLGNTVGMDPTKVHCGMKMEVAFEKIDDEITLVNWKPAERS
ncbi:Zn-ribbon domain-containing OB-fold protein [Ammoniphilus sp. YIM 78166]|uniref:Zn-ribbon domain-containing OB-fold protein n=1 Tax=Ammoniphilus sp. YIM 78166 TaxID=1644106 RepID=UPI00106FBF04|nr:OB-fold domain-containing protein [Ammoniphilus sp. YIM 78166]